MVPCTWYVLFYRWTAGTLRLSFAKLINYEPTHNRTHNSTHSTQRHMYVHTYQVFLSAYHPFQKFNEQLGIDFSVKCGYHVPGPTRLGKMSKPLPSSRFHFWKPCSGNSGDCHVWNLATDPSSPHSADGCSAADISPSGLPRRDFGKPYWKVL